MMWLILLVIPYIVNASLLGLQQDDPLLINQIKPLIHPPSELDYNFTKEPDLNGQFGQAIEVSKLLGGQTNGFFIEAGAFNGQDISNTLLLEMQYNWTGILIEPNPDLYQEMLTKQRKSYCLETCLSTEKEVQKVDFDATGAFLHFFPIHIFFKKLFLFFIFFHSFNFIFILFLNIFLSFFY